MEAMFEAVADEFAGDVVHVAVVEADEPESALVDRLREVRAAFDVTVGSYPGEVVRLKVQHVEPDVAEAAADWLRERVETPG
jgi:hypothetical protein